MFHVTGKFVERWWRTILIVWAVLLLASAALLRGWVNDLNLGFRVPRWLEVAQDGEFAFLPREMPSLIGEQLLAQAFPDDLLKSSVVVVVRRESAPLVKKGEQKSWPISDEEFIEDVLKPRLEKIKDDASIGADGKSLISKVKTFTDPLMGKLLVSEDQKASLVIIALTTEFLEWRNEKTVERIQDLISKDLKAEQKIPPGLDLAMSGSATVGRDMLVANRDSAKQTELWTTILVVALLVVIYRAPVLALIPLVTVFTAVYVSLALELLLTQVPQLHFGVFRGMEVYITVVCYGAGVDYCLFLIARYKEELDAGAGLKNAVSSTLGRVGAALTASAGTVICGIGMMIFAQFGKFREAGVGISLALCVVLGAALTFTPALLIWAGRWAFWRPFAGTNEISPVGGRVSPTRIITRLVERNRIQVVWEHVGKLLVNHPAKILAVCFAAMIPFAVIGLWFHDHLSYGLLTELQPTKQSVIGAKAVQEHFPPGYAGPLTILLHNDKIDFADAATRTALLDPMIEKLHGEREKLGIHDIRFVSEPLGFRGREIVENLPRVQQIMSRARAISYYVSNDANELKGHVTRIDVVFHDDPFSRESIRQLTDVDQAVRAAMPDDLRQGTEIQFVGATPSIRDLKVVTDHDQVKIDILVLCGVFVILVLLLRKPAISMYLVLSVFFSYFVTLGVSIAVFWAMDPEGFAGLDWKVPMFLFTILIAIGEDYNIFLMTRIEEEQERHGPVEGIRIALLRTGSIISSCGIIMAGTFCSLMFGVLVGMQQLGFALAFGVLLDTFIVRPVLVPAYLILLFGGRFGGLGRFLGQKHFDPSPGVMPGALNARADV